MTFLAHPTHYARDEFRALVAGVKIGAWAGPQTTAALGTGGLA